MNQLTKQLFDQCGYDIAEEDFIECGIFPEDTLDTAFTKIQEYEKFLENVKSADDEKLERMWQFQANMIGNAAMDSWHAESKDEENRLRAIAENAQHKQEIVQKEITARHT